MSFTTMSLTNNTSVSTVGWNIIDQYFKYSYDGINFTLSTNTIFTSECWSITYGRNRWVAAGEGTNTLAYSNDGINWTGLGTSIFSSVGYIVAFNGALWLAGGEGTNTLAYSYDGINWVGLGTSVFTQCRALSWNSKNQIWVGGGTISTANRIAYSYNGLDWIINASQPFPNSVNTPRCWGLSSVILSNGNTRWLAGMSTATFGGSYSRDAPNVFAYSNDGITWVGLGVSWYDKSRSIADGLSFTSSTKLYIAGIRRRETNNIRDYTPFLGYSSDGIAWNKSTIIPGTLTSSGYDTSYNGVYWYSESRYSTNAINWSTGLPISISGSNFAGNVMQNNFAMVATGEGSYSIGYSQDGSIWYPSSTSVFSTRANNVAWNGKIWLAVGEGSNTLAYSSNGIRWEAIATSPFTTAGYNIDWSSSVSRWVAVGAGTNTLAYSSDGTNWTSVTGIFTTTGRGVTWNATRNRWIAVGEGTNSIAYSTDGISWTGIGTSVFTTTGYDVACDGSTWVAVGSGTNTLAYSTDNGVNWTGVSGIFTTAGRGVEWSSTLSRWVAVGQGTNTLAYSFDGKIWIGLSTSIFTTNGLSVIWNGKRWNATGSGTNSIGYSKDGIVWTGLGTNIFSTAGNGVSYISNRIASSFPVVAVGESTNPNSICYTLTTSGTTSWSYTPGLSVFQTRGNSVFYNGTLWVAGGLSTAQRDTIAYSTDGISWTRVTSLIIGQVYKMVWESTNSRWLALGGPYSDTLGSGVTVNALRSDDGITWTTSINNIDVSYFYDAAWDGSKWVMVGANGVSVALSTGVIYTYDYTTYTDVTPVSMFGTATYGIAWYNSRFVAVGGDIRASTTDSIAYSDDGGSTWTAVTGSPSIFTNGFAIACNNLASPNTLWVAVGEGTYTIAYSSDGISWTGVSGSTSIFSEAGYGITWNSSASLWIATGKGGNVMATSSNGTTWTAITTTPFSFLANAVACKTTAPARWVGVGQGSEGQNTVAYSDNSGTTWTTSYAYVFSTRGYAVANNGTIWVAVGEGTNTLAYSLDGTNWTGLGTSIFTTRGLGIAWNGSRWVAVGQGTNTMAYSDNGTKWTAVSGTVFTTAGRGVTWSTNLGRWVAVGEGTYSILYSSNATTWTNITGTNPFSVAGYGVACNGGSVFIAVGDGASNTIATSTDGINWTGRGKTTFSTIGRGVAFSVNTTTNGRWVAVGQGTNTVAYSDDNGANWTAASGTVFTTIGYGVTWVPFLGKWIAVGQGTNTIIESTDGNTWSASTQPSGSTAWYGVSW